jgi:hypothetical protein
MTKRAAVITIALVFVFSALAYADAPLVLTPPNFLFTFGGAGGGRGDIVTMTGNYALTSIGITINIANGAQMTMNAYVYDDQGGIGVNPLAVGTSMVLTGDGTTKFYDLPIAYLLQAGQNYDIGVDFQSYNDPNLQVSYYAFTDSDPSFSVGPVTVLDGEEGHCGPCNVFAPQLRLNGAGTVPEPGTFLLLAGGALALFARRKLV